LQLPASNSSNRELERLLRDLKNFDIREVVAQAALGLFKSFSVEMLQRSMVTTEGQLIVPADLAARYMRLSRIHWDEIDED